MCCVAGGICVVSVDFLTVPAANSIQRIGQLPDGLKPLGHTFIDTTVSEAAYIAPLRYRGENDIYGQLMVSKKGEINVYANRDGYDYAYFYGQLVFPVTRS